jgi:hypothetical protein
MSTKSAFVNFSKITHCTDATVLGFLVREPPLWRKQEVLLYENLTKAES